jgi:hypothetical protein
MTKEVRIQLKLGYLFSVAQPSRLRVKRASAPLFARLATRRRPNSQARTPARTPACSGWNEYPSGTGFRRNCAAARGADIAARCPYLAIAKPMERAFSALASAVRVPSPRICLAWSLRKRTERGLQSAGRLGSEGALKFSNANLQCRRSCGINPAPLAHPWFGH